MTVLPESIKTTIERKNADNNNRVLTVGRKGFWVSLRIENPNTYISATICVEDAKAVRRALSRAIREIDELSEAAE